MLQRDLHFLSTFFVRTLLETFFPAYDRFFTVKYFARAKKKSIYLYINSASLIETSAVELFFRKPNCDEAEIIQYFLILIVYVKRYLHEARVFHWVLVIEIFLKIFSLKLISINSTILTINGEKMWTINLLYSIFILNLMEMEHKRSHSP